MNKLDDLLVFPTLLLSIGIYVAVFVFRSLFEAIWPALADGAPVTLRGRLWGHFVLPTLPAGLGLLFCILVPPELFAYPTIVVASVASRMLYGVGTGWFNQYIYSMISGVLQKKWNLPLTSEQAPSPPPSKRG
jgi:hypothetical protein